MVVAVVVKTIELWCWNFRIVVVVKTIKFAVMDSLYKCEAVDLLSVCV